MRLLLLSTFVFASLVVINCAWADSSPSDMVRAALEQLDVPVYRAEVLTIGTGPDSAPHKMLHRIVIASGPKNRYLEEIEPVHMIEIMDGTTEWWSAPELHQYLQMPYRENHEPAELALLQTLAHSQAAETNSADDEALSIGSALVPCYVITARFDGSDQPANGKQGRSYVPTLWIDKATGTLRQAAFHDAKSNTTTTIVIVSFETNPDLDARQFEYKPDSTDKRMERGLGPWSNVPPPDRN